MKDQFLIYNNSEAQQSTQDSQFAQRITNTKPRAYERSSDSRSPTVADAPPRIQAAAKPSIRVPRRDHNIDESFALIHIPDLTTRQYVAQLMAVAPGLEIPDLYHNLLTDMKGDFAAARKQVIRASRAPSIYPSIKPEPDPLRPQPKRDRRMAREDYGDEVMVKIDPNEDFLEWVSPIELGCSCDIR
jgi:hypothetical protein